MKPFIALTAAFVVALCADLIAAPQRTVSHQSVVAYGSNGEKVKEVQAKLSKLGYLKLNGRPPGFFRRDTDKGTRRLQADSGLPVTGVWTSKEDAVADKLLKQKRPKSEMIVVKAASSPSTFDKRLLAMREAAIRKAGADFEARQKKEAKATKPVKKPTTEIKSLRGAKTTYATVFAYAGDPYDPTGYGSPYLSEDINCPLFVRNMFGVALPAEDIARMFNVPLPPLKPQQRNFTSYKAYAEAKALWWEKVLQVHAAWAKVRKARVEILCAATGKRLFKDPVRIVDLGPGDGPQARGVEMDLTPLLNKAIKGTGKTWLAYRVLPEPKTSFRLFADTETDNLNQQDIPFTPRVYVKL